LTLYESEGQAARSINWQANDRQIGIRFSIIRSS